MSEQRSQLPHSGYALNGPTKGLVTNSSFSAEQSSGLSHNAHTTLDVEKDRLAKRRLENFLVDTANYQVLPRQTSAGMTAQTRVKHANNCLDKFEAEMEYATKSS